MARECHPVWRQFAFRRFGPGDSMAALLRRFPPKHREEFGRYGIYTFHPWESNAIPFTGLTVTSRDGKLLSASAGSCTWQFIFFSTKDPEIDRAYAAFRRERHESFERRELDRLEIALRNFYSQQNRWPTNPQEFSDFVTGMPSVTTNDFHITLVQQPDGALEIAFIDLPGEKRSVAKPAR
jgi:hypothetical protein